MNTIGAIFPNTGYQQRYIIKPSQVVTNQQQSPYDGLIEILFNSSAGQKILRQFLNKPQGFYRNYLYSSLTPAQKFEKIFGVNINKVFQQRLGDIFSDIGNWFGNLFSQQNISNAENFLRRVSNESQQYANAINVFRNQQQQNQQYNPQEQTQARDKITKGIFDVKSFIDEYGIFIIGGLVVILFFKK